MSGSSVHYHRPTRGCDWAFAILLIIPVLSIADDRPTIPLVIRGEMIFDASGHPVMVEAPPAPGPGRTLDAGGAIGVESVVGCDGDPLFAQSPPNPGLQCRNSSFQRIVGSEQQVSDDFLLEEGGAITGLMLWAVYTGDQSVPEIQDLVIRIYEDNRGAPGEVAREESMAVAPVRTEERQIPYNLAIYEFAVTFNEPFEAAENTTYWLSAMGDTDGKLWCWQFNEASGEHLLRRSERFPWISFQSNFAFELCGEGGGGGGDCTGNERIQKAKCKEKRGKFGMTVKLDGGLGEDTYEVELSSGERESGKLKGSGKAKIKFKNLPKGNAKATVKWGCGAEDEADYRCR